MVNKPTRHGLAVVNQRPVNYFSQMALTRKFK